MSPQDRLNTLTNRIQLACQQSGRPSDSVHLLAVSKTFPAEAIQEFASLGLRSFGENYLQEAESKITHLAESPECPSLEWHFIGPIQSNKTRKIASLFHWVHSVDRHKIAQRLSEQRPPEMPELNILLQVNTSGETSKSGMHPDEVVSTALEIAKLPHLRLRGLMTVPDPNHHEASLRAEFLECANLLKALQQAGLEVDTLSMGMSADLEIAIDCGANWVRVGSALFGQRSYPETK